MPDRELYHDTYVPHTFELILKSVKYGGVGNHVISHESYGGEMLGTGYVYFLIVYLTGKFQTTYLRTIGISGGHVKLCFRF